MLRNRRVFLATFQGMGGVGSGFRPCGAFADSRLFGKGYQAASLKTKTGVWALAPIVAAKRAENLYLRRSGFAFNCSVAGKPRFLSVNPIPSMMMLWILRRSLCSFLQRLMDCLRQVAAE